MPNFKHGALMMKGNRPLQTNVWVTNYTTFKVTFEYSCDSDTTMKANVYLTERGLNGDFPHETINLRKTGEKHWGKAEIIVSSGIVSKRRFAHIRLWTRGEYPIRIRNVEVERIKEGEPTAIKEVQEVFPSEITNIGIVLRSNELHARILSEQTGYPLVKYTVYEMKEYDTLIYLAPFITRTLQPLKEIKKKYPDIRIIMWWVGTDVFKAVTQAGYDLKLIKWLSTKHVCVSKGLQDELKSVGIDAEVVTLIPETYRYKKCRLPKKYTVGVYLPSTRLDFYGYKDIIEIMNRTPNINYIVYGNKDRIELPPNAKDAGWVTDTTNVIKKCNCLLRLTKHDGFPQSLIESILMGRYFIINHDYPDIKATTSVDEIVEKIKQKPELDPKCTEHYKELFNPVALRNRLNKVIYGLSTVSVITFVYCTEENDRLKQLKECIESVKSQEYPLYEHIIVDDGSTIPLRKEIKEMNDSHLKYYRMEHTGITESVEPFRFGLRFACGDHIIFLASDDTHLPNTMRTLSGYLDRNPNIVAVVGNSIFEKHTENGITSTKVIVKESKPIRDALMDGNLINGCAIMFRRNVLSLIDLPPDECGFCGDWDMWLKISEVGKIERIPDIVVKYRRFKDATSNKTRGKKEYRKKHMDYVRNSAKKRRASQKQRLRVFYQVGKVKNPKPTSGDLIAELSIMKAISKFADVDNDETKEHDLHYVRNNANLFLKLPEPKIYVSVPYHDAAHRCATAITTVTRTWSNRLRNGGDDVAGRTPNKNIITMHQVVDDTFKPLQDHVKTKAIRKDIGGDFIIGHFGSIRESCYPYSFLAILPRLKKKYPNLKVIFGHAKGRLGDVQKDNITYVDYNYSDMPYVISACDLILYNMRTDAGHLAGSMKVLEAMACGVPVLAPKFDARVEELGEDYELFYPYKTNNGRFPKESEDIMFKKICEVIDNKSLRKRVSDKLLKRIKFYRIDTSSKRLEKLFRELL